MKPTYQDLLHALKDLLDYHQCVCLMEKAGKCQFCVYSDMVGIKVTPRVPEQRRSRQGAPGLKDPRITVTWCPEPPESNKERLKP